MIEDLVLHAPLVEQVDNVDLGGAKPVRIHLALPGNNQAIVSRQRPLELAHLLVLID